MVELFGRPGLRGTGNVHQFRLPLAAAVVDHQDAGLMGVGSMAHVHAGVRLRQFDRRFRQRCGNAGVAFLQQVQRQIKWKSNSMAQSKRGGPRQSAGRPRATPSQTTVSELARAHTATALQVLVDVAKKGDSEAECADEGEQTCRALLFELGVMPRQRP